MVDVPSVSIIVHRDAAMRCPSVTFIHRAYNANVYIGMDIVKTISLRIGVATTAAAILHGGNDIKTPLEF